MQLDLLLHKLGDAIYWLTSSSRYCVPLYAALLWLVLLLNRATLIQFFTKAWRIQDEKAVEAAIQKKIDIPLQAMLILLALAPFLDLLPGFLGKTAVETAYVLVPLLALHMLIQASDIAIFHLYFLNLRNRKVPEVFRIFTISIIYLVCVLMLLDWAFHINVLPVLAESTILTAVIGLSLQDTLKNVFAGLMMGLERRFSEGDWVTFRDGANSTVGEVIEIGWRTTQIRMRDNHLASIPNVQFTNNQLINLSSPTRVTALFIEIPVAVQAGKNFSTLRESLEKVTQETKGVMAEPLVSIQPVRLNIDNLLVRINFSIADYQQAEIVTAAVLERCLVKVIEMNFAAQPPPPPPPPRPLPAAPGLSSEERPMKKGK